MDLAKGVLRGAFAKADGDLPALTKDDMFHLHSNLSKIAEAWDSVTSLEYTECLVWIFDNVEGSPTRTAALGKFLIKTVDLEAQRSAATSANVTFSETSDPRRARQSQGNASPDKVWYCPHDAQADGAMHAACVASSLLWLIELVLIAQKDGIKIGEEGRAPSDFASSIMDALSHLVGVATPKEGKPALDFHRSMHTLLNTWMSDELIGTIYLMKLREVARRNYNEWLAWLRRTHPNDYDKLKHEVDLHPALEKQQQQHGNRRHAWHQLPAASMLSQVETQTPIQTKSMRPLSFEGEDIDPMLLDIVDQHTQEADNIFSLPKRGSNVDHSHAELNSLGFPIHEDPNTGKRKLLETYYGHSARHIEHLKRRKTASATVPPTQPSTMQKPETPQTGPPPPSSSQQHQQTSRHPPPPPPPHPMALRTDYRKVPPPAPAPPRISAHQHSPPPQQQQPPPPLPLPPTSGYPPAFPIPPPRPPNWQGPWPPPPPALGGIVNGFVPPPPPPPPQLSRPPPTEHYGGSGFGNGQDQRSGGYVRGSSRGGYGGRDNH